jgi:predicted dehydrogenase
MSTVPQKIRVGVVGCGGEAMLYLEDYFLTGIAGVTIVQDIDAAKAQRCAEKFGVPRWTTDLQEVLASDVDVVDISTPNHLHASQTVAALEAGKHVLVQKPMAPTVEDCEAMIAAARKANRKLGLCMTALNDPLNHEIKQMIRSGFFGRISSVRTRNAHRGGLFMKPKEQHWRGSVEKTGGGSFIQLAIHGINLVQWLLESEIIRVAAFSKNLMCQDRLEGDDVTNAIGEFANGIQATMESSYCAGGGVIEIHGSEGYLIRQPDDIILKSTQHFAGELLACAGQNLEVRVSTASLKDKTEKLMTKYNQHQLFVRAVAEGQPPPVPGEVGLRDVKIVKAVYAAAKEKRTVEIR